MYFPILNTMNRYQGINDFLTQKIDIWLGTRRTAVRKHLSPLQFSLDSNIDEDIAISLFVICTQHDINLLKDRYVVHCPDCNRILGTFGSPLEIPNYIYCIECDHDVNITKNNITIWFQLLKEPEEQSFSKYARNIKEGVDSMGKDISLRPQKIESSSNPMVRRLLGNLNERFRSTT